MTNLFTTFDAEPDEADFSPLEPMAKYFSAMDCLIYLTEDVSYRAVRLSPLITVLLHPAEDRAIGLKVKGMRDVVEQLRAILRAQKVHLSEADVIELLAVIELAFTLQLGDKLLAEADADRRRRYEPEVKRLATQAGAIHFALKEPALAA